MDPKANLTETSDLLFYDCGVDREERIDSLMDSYVNWRGIGGSNPVMDDGSSGDEFFSKLVQAYEKIFGAYLGARLPD